ncbi:MAG: T9SS type A sorting domain-containing protein [Salibacter sp.]|uniref:T9SS type A sorting domain-containing protein n=1 Tax=Salibacter sp. TaxID=2010995 RepID=UPI0028707822|nr:T9SS type A sorting domain-containing protein [Salibacter sp.]MDR9399191.1 T9SS type A sorting domain-containing protein [Salibacter sp.]
MRYILAIIALLAFSMKSNGQAKLYDNINSQADVDSVANGIALDYYDIYRIYLENDTTLPLNEQIHDISALGQNGDTLYLYMFDTRVNSITSVAQSCEIRGFASVNNPLLTDVSPIINSSVYRFILEKTPVSGDLVFNTDYKHIDFEVTNCDQVTSIEVNAPNLVKNPVSTRDNELVIQQNDSLKYFSINNPKGGLDLFDFNDNRQLDSIYISHVANYYGKKDLGFKFNPELKSVEGFLNKDTVTNVGLTVQYNYELEELCSMKKTFENNSGDLADYLVINQNGPGLNSIQEMMSTSCSTTGLGEESSPIVTVYPNPANDRVFIKGVNNATPYEFYSLTGEVVKTGTLQANGVIDVNQFSSGVYLLKIGEQTEKVIVQ